MKRLITIILVLALLLPAAALAESDEPARLNTDKAYALIKIEKDGTPHLYAIYCNDDGTCYYFAFECISGFPSSSSILFGKWEYTETNEVKVTLLDRSVKIFHIMKNSIIDTETMECYWSFPTLTI